jgi:FlaG/FlaF family flagellin (archaellin)
MDSEDCPVCGINVKIDNMPRHLKKVHPNDESTKDYSRMVEEKLRRRKSSKAPMSPGAKRVVAVIVIIAILVISSGLLYLWYTGLDHPSIDVSPTQYDFGDIPQGVSTASFQIWNPGEVDLKLSGVSTSCGCTSAVIKYRGIISPVFGMHNNPQNWNMNILPGDTAILEVSYDSALHPDSGFIERAVYIKSNDPFNPEVQVDLTANVMT